MTQAVISFFLSDDIDNNPLSSGKDIERLKYEAEQRKINPEKYADG